MAATVVTVMKKRRGPKFRALEAWQLEILAEPDKNPQKKLRKR